MDIRTFFECRKIGFHPVGESSGEIDSKKWDCCWLRLTLLTAFAAAPPLDDDEKNDAKYVQMGWNAPSRTIVINSRRPRTHMQRMLPKTKTMSRGRRLSRGETLVLLGWRLKRGLILL